MFRFWPIQVLHWPAWFSNLNLKPDIVIQNKATKTVDIFELTCQGEQRIETAHRLKAKKYQHFSKDITNYKATVIPFEIGSNTGFVSERNKASIKKLHSYCKKGIKLKKFVENISAVTILSSYYIFNCRNNRNWDDLDPISGHSQPTNYRNLHQLFILKRNHFVKTSRKICDIFFGNPH